jgi:thiosulfate reductase cytochrome b subunit
MREWVKRDSGVVRATHWLNAVLLVGMIASGLQIYTAFPHFGMKGDVYPVPNPFDSSRLPSGIPAWARLGGWLAGGLNWHFALAWPFVLTGVVYVGFLVLSGQWRSLLFRARDIRPALQMQLYYLHLRREHPPQGKHNALQKAAYTFIVLLGAISAASGFAIYKPVQFGWLTALFGGYELARYWHFVTVWLFIAFTIVHVALVLLVDPASLRGMITGWYRGRFPGHD